MSRIFNLPDSAFLLILDSSDNGSLITLDRELRQRLGDQNISDDERASLSNKLNIMRAYMRRRFSSPPREQVKRKDDDNEPPNQKDIYRDAKRQQQGNGLKGSSGNKWIQHVKAYASKHGMKYGEALSSPDCKKTYKS